ncbi:triose-phosphate isomerase [Bacillus taeanensis]|nr:triose-phosphate isomerase [Bacillus taeanensis]
MKKVYIGTNWKMTKTYQEGAVYCNELLKISQRLSSDIQLFVIPSYTMLSSIKEILKESTIQLGAQNMHWEEKGAYTGEISPTMLSEIGIDLVELGHSERRQYYNENDEDINKKVLAALNYEMNPLICIGENMNQKENNISVETLAAQLKVCLKNVSEEDLANIRIAYEPVWAIGENGIPASADYVNEIHNEIRSILTTLYGSKGKNIPLLYGGSVNLENFLEYLQLDNVDGLFIGRSAWDMTSFKEILSSIDNLLTEEVNS